MNFETSNKFLFLLPHRHLAHIEITQHKPLINNYVKTMFLLCLYGSNYFSKWTQYHLPQPLRPNIRIIERFGEVEGFSAVFLE
jgi:hypothetical protein